MRDGDVRIEAVEFEEWSGKGSLLDSFFIHDDDFFLPLHHEDFFFSKTANILLSPESSSLVRVVRMYVWKDVSVCISC